MFEHDRSAARGNMAVRDLIIFKHDSSTEITLPISSLRL